MSRLALVSSSMADTKIKRSFIDSRRTTREIPEPRRWDEPAADSMHTISELWDELHLVTAEE